MRAWRIAVALTVVGVMGCDDRQYIDLQPEPTPPPSFTATRPPTTTPTPTATLAAGANIGFIGVLRSFDELLDPAEYDSEGRPVFERAVGSGWQLVVEAKPGTNGAPVGTSSYDPDDRPDLQVAVDRDLGDGSPAVCDTEDDNFGGVPGVQPPRFDDTPEISDALNDLGCRFTNGIGDFVGRGPEEACVLFRDGERRFVDPSTTVQFCARITLPMSFPTGETLVAARVRDESGLVGPERQIVVRVGGS